MAENLAKVCIYCSAPLTPATRKAHVWPASLGGRLKSRATCCDDCNNAIGSAEDRLREALAHTFASVGAVNDEGDPIEVNLEHDGREFVLASGNAVLQVTGARFDHANKSVVVPLPAGLDQQADKMARALRSHNFEPDDVDSKLSITPGDPRPVLPVGPTRSEHDVSVGGTVEHKRVFAKMALELLAHHRHDLAVSEELSAARRFARYGEGTLRSKPDTRSAGSRLLEDVERPEVFNAIEVWTFGYEVYFRAIFLGPIAFTGTLTTSWSGQQFRAAYGFDARSPAAVIVDRFDDVHGPRLSVGFDAAKAVAELEEISLRLAQTAPRLEQEAPPDVGDLRQAVKQKLAALRPKKRRR